MRVLQRIPGTKSGRQPYLYQTADKRILASYHEARTWSGRLGSYLAKEWVAYSRELVTASADPSEYQVARGETLGQCEHNLAKYLADLAAGTLGKRSRYGFNGDQRPMVAIPQVAVA